MNRISVNNVLPQIFAGRSNVESDVWATSVTFSKGNVYLVSADSGTGKSSLCSYIYGVRRDYSGTISFDDRDISSLSVREWCGIRNREIAYLPQELRLFPELTALENVLIKNRITGYRTEDEIHGYFKRFGIADKIGSLVSRLSIGQQQRVAVIRTLCQPCDFFLLDEPVSHLDEKNNNIIAETIADEAARMGAGVIFTSVGNNLNLLQMEVLKL